MSTYSGDTEDSLERGQIFCPKVSLAQGLLIMPLLTLHQEVDYVAKRFISF